MPDAPAPAAPAATPAAPAPEATPAATPEAPRGPDGKFQPRASMAERIAALKGGAPGEEGEAAPAAEAAAPAEAAQEKPPEAAPKEKLSPQFAALKKAEAEVRKEREALKAEREKHAKDVAEYQARQALKSKSVREWMKAEGLDVDTAYKALTEEYLTGKPQAVEEVKPPPASPEVLELKKQLEELRRENDEAKQAALTREATAYLTKVTADVQAAGEKYELVNAAGEEGYARVHAVINEAARTSGKVLSADEAAALVEAELEEALPSLERFLKTKKGASKLAPKVEAVGSTPQAGSTPPASEPGQRRVVRTLTNSLVASPPPAAKRRLSVDERAALLKEKYRQG
jgi:hypothetical protein